MKTLDVKTNYRTYKECFLRVERYWHDGSISLTIWNQNDGCVARVTTCLVDHSLREDEAYVDANNCPWAVAFLEKNGFAKRTGKKRRSARRRMFSERFCRGGEEDGSERQNTKGH